MPPSLEHASKTSAAAAFIVVAAALAIPSCQTSREPAFRGDGGPAADLQDSQPTDTRRSDVLPSPPPTPFFVQVKAGGLYQGQTAVELGVTLAWQSGLEPSWAPLPLVIRQAFDTEADARVFEDHAVFTYEGETIGIVPVSLAVCDFVTDLGYFPAYYRSALVDIEVYFADGGKFAPPAGATVAGAGDPGKPASVTCRRSPASSAHALPRDYELVYRFTFDRPGMRFMVNGAVVTPEAISSWSERAHYEVLLRFPRDQPKAAIASTLSVVAGNTPVGVDIPVRWNECSDTGLVQVEYLTWVEDHWRTTSWECLDEDGTKTTSPWTDWF